jgi:alkylation response protein AidB-like acyl-CoA dehydrogenase
MQFLLTDEELKWRAEVREFAARYVEAGLVNEQADRHGRPGYSHLEKQYYQEIATRGWNGLHWPPEYGGRENSATISVILSSELEYARLPQLDWTVNSLAPVIIKYGTPENLAMWLEPIRRGDVIFALGYSESDAGTDLANLRTRAVLDGGEWVINGEKLWNSGAHFATHEWLAVRTDHDAPKHRGISVLIVPMDAPGIAITPLWVWSDRRTNLVRFDNVRVPAANLIGQVNDGWRYIVGALDFERADIGGRVIGCLRRLLDDLIQYCTSTTIDGDVLVNRESTRLQLAELEVAVEVATLMTYEVAGIIDTGRIPTLEGTMQKILASELRTQMTDLGMQMMELYGQLNFHDPLAGLAGEIEREYRRAPVQRFGGGTNEVLRDIVAQRGLGLLRSPR